jgi:uncharacterized membrane protein YdjX (TVP38/TMEM64 family)
MVFGTLFVVGVTVALVLAYTFKTQIFEWLQSYSDWVRANAVLGILSFVVSFIIAQPFCLPAMWFSILGSFMFSKIFGYLLGMLIFSFVDYSCMILGSQLAFWNGRYLFKTCVVRALEGKPRLTALQDALSNNSKKLVALTRLCYATPYWLFNYVCGVSKMSSLNYFIGNLAIYPCCLPSVYIGASISSATDVDSGSS